MKKFLLLLALISFLLSACSVANTSPSENSPNLAEPREESNGGLSAGGDAGSSHPQSEALLDKYIDVTALPVLDIAIESSATFDDRTISLEDSVDNELEWMAYNRYYYQAAAEFDLLLGLVGENESLQNAMSNEARHFLEGAYLSDYTIHALDTLTSDEVQQLSDGGKESISRMIDEYGFAKYGIVTVDVSWTHNEASLAQGPQLGNGRYKQYFLFATTQETPDFKLYEIYWEDFM